MYMGLGWYVYIRFRLVCVYTPEAPGGLAAAAPRALLVPPAHLHLVLRGLQPRQTHYIRKRSLLAYHLSLSLSLSHTHTNTRTLSLSLSTGVPSLSLFLSLTHSLSPSPSLSLSLYTVSTSHHLSFTHTTSLSRTHTTLQDLIPAKA